jgi:hypothetical protein
MADVKPRFHVNLRYDMSLELLAKETIDDSICSLLVLCQFVTLFYEGFP